MSRIESQPEILKLWYRINGFVTIREKMICKEWKKTNPEGIYNFYAWAFKQIKEKKLDLNFMKLIREDESLPWSPENCKLLDKREEESWKAREWLQDADVIKIRKLVKKNKSLTIQDLAEQYRKDPQTISDAVRGVTYQHLNEKEPPVIRRPAQIEEFV